MNLIKPSVDNSFTQVEAVFTAELKSLYRYACYRMGAREEAQDVIQELYLKLHKQGLSR
jgi:DNA-directed RNA polymerase specialized sigma24 family protein